MKIKVSKKGLDNAEKLKKSRKGRTSRNKGSNFERVIAKKFNAKYGVELVRTPQSGGFAKSSSKAKDFRGDITSLDEETEFMLHIECKNQKTWSLPNWLKQAEGDCPRGRVPVIIFHKDGTSKDYVSLSLEDFFTLVPKEAIIKEGENEDEKTQ